MLAEIHHSNVDQCSEKALRKVHVHVVDMPDWISANGSARQQGRSSPSFCRSSGGPLQGDNFPGRKLGEQRTYEEEDKNN